MKILKTVLTAGVLLVSQQLMAKTTMLAVYCLADTNDSVIYVDGEAVGSCSDGARELIGDITPGTHKVEVVRAIDQEYERRFVEEITAVEGRPSRVRVALPEKAMTAYGLEMQANREEQARLAQQERDFEQALQAAENGDTRAMTRVSSYYAQGLGTEVDDEKAAYWKKQPEVMEDRAAFTKALAAAEDESQSYSQRRKAMTSLANMYRAGTGTEVSEEKAQEWEQRLKALDREERIAGIKKQMKDSRPFDVTLTLLSGPSLENEDPILLTTFIPLSPITTVTELISSPFDSSEYSKYKKELEEVESQASRWANPEAMIAQSAN